MLPPSITSSLTHRYSFQCDKSVYLEPSYINGKTSYFFPPKTHRNRVRFSVFITGTMIIVDILCVTAVFYLKFYLTRVVQQKNGDVIAEVVNAVQIQLLEYIYTKIGTFYCL
jgi:hypothetical protein